MSVPPAPPIESPPTSPIRVAVRGRTRRGLWWEDELTTDPRFALTNQDDADALLRCDAGRVTLEMPQQSGEPLPVRPARFTAAFAAVRSALAYFSERPLGDTPRDFTLIEHTQTPLGPLPEHGTALDRLEARLDELLALSGWTAPRLVGSTRCTRGEEETRSVRLEDTATGGTALVEIVRGAAIRWESGWSVRTPAGAFHNETLTTREPAGELAARPWTAAESSPLDALHAHVTGGEPWPVTAAQTAAVAGLMDQLTRMESRDR